MTCGTKGEPACCLVSAGPTITAKASSEGWRLRLRPNIHQLKMRKWLKKKRMKTKTMSHLERRTLIKGEMKMIKTRKMIKKFRIKDHHTQESTKQFKKITP
jgi:hypothetical protein